MSYTRSSKQIFTTFVSFINLFYVNDHIYVNTTQYFFDHRLVFQTKSLPFLRPASQLQSLYHVAKELMCEKHRLNTILVLDIFVFVY